MSTVIDAPIEFIGKALEIYGKYQGLEVEYGKTSEGKNPITKILEKILGLGTNIVIQNAMMSEEPLKFQNIVFGDKGGIVVWGDGTYTIYESGTQQLSHIYSGATDCSIQAYGITEFGNEAFQTGRYTNRSIINLSTDVTKFGDYCFGDCESVEMIVASKVEELGQYCFKGCNKLTSLDISNVQTLSEGCFYYTGFTSMTFANYSRLTDIPKSCFEECPYLANIVLSDNTSYLGKKAFRNCHNLEKVTSGVSDYTQIYSIDDYAFENCYKLNHFASTHIEWIGQYVFKGCSQYSNFQTKGAVEVSDYAFAGSSLHYITINNCVSLGDCVFEDITEVDEEGVSHYCLIKIRLGSTPPEVTEETFDGLDSSVVISVPVGAKATYESTIGYEGVVDQIVEET